MFLTVFLGSYIFRDFAKFEGPYLWYTWGWPDFLIQLHLTGLHQNTPDRAGHDPATKHFGGADHRGSGPLA